MSEITYIPERAPNKVMHLDFYSGEAATPFVTEITQKLLLQNRLYDLGMYMDIPLERLATVDHEDIVENFRISATNASLNLIATESEKPVGWAHLRQGIFEDPSQNDIYFISRLILPSARRLGLGENMTRAILTTAFNELGAKIIISEVHQTNIGSIRSNQKVSLSLKNPAIVYQNLNKIYFQFSPQPSE